MGVLCYIVRGCTCQSYLCSSNFDVRLTCSTNLDLLAGCRPEPSLDNRLFSFSNKCIGSVAQVSEMLFLLTLSFAASSPSYRNEYERLPNLGEYNLQPDLPGFEYSTVPSPIHIDDDFRHAASKQQDTLWSSWTKCSEGISGWFQTRMRKGKCHKLQVYTITGF